MEDNYFVHDMSKVEEMIKMLDGKADATERPIPQQLLSIFGLLSAIDKASQYKH